MVIQMYVAENFEFKFSRVKNHHTHISPLLAKIFVHGKCSDNSAMLRQGSDSIFWKINIFSPKTGFPLSNGDEIL